ncbi:hypothetical protein P8452_53522 [Trifolium repens]|nr:hypothetical protein P8452_53522 [Trifolium repens]
MSGNEHNNNIVGGVSKIIWDKVGEAEPDRDIMMFELEQECLEVYIMLFKLLELLLKLSNNNDLVTITTL